jgi:hypothetical protein
VWLRANATQDFQSIYLGKLKVQQDNLWQIRWVAFYICTHAKEIIERFRSIANNDNLICDFAFVQCPKGQGFVVCVIFDQKDHFLIHFYRTPIEA